MMVRPEDHLCGATFGDAKRFPPPDHSLWECRA